MTEYAGAKAAAPFSLSQPATSDYNPCMVTQHLSFLGGFEVRINETDINHFPTDKTRALLAYLAIESDNPVPRPQLATLLWGDLSDEAARSNLRKSLFRLRKTLGEAADTLLAVSRSEVHFKSQTAVIDLLRFEQLSRSEHLEELAQAAALYRGELLAGLVIEDAPEFEEWLFARREQLVQQLLNMLAKQAELALAQKPPAPEIALAAAQRQLALEPWREVAHRQLMRTYALTGQRAEALAQYERCLLVLEEELGIEPSAETEKLALSIRGEQLMTTHLYGFERGMASFVGRERDINRLISRLHGPDTRLVTVTGPGGIGKTRLATEAIFRSVAQRSAYFVPLEGVTTPAGVWQKLGERLEITPGPRGISPESIITFLAERSPLILFDNYEQLLPNTEVVERLLARTEAVQLLITSRAPLKLRAEFRLALEGLPIPPPGTAAAELGDYGAAQLLQTTGEQVNPDLAITDENVPAIIEICTLLDGMPLALEMAGSWLALFTPQLLVVEIEKNLDLLVATRQDIPERHRSLRAIFDHALAQLSPQEKGLIRHLTLFQGSFGLHDAIILLQASPVMLNNLIDHALLQRRSENRFALHPLLLTFLSEREPVAEGLKEAHAAHYLAKIKGLRSEAGKANFAEIRPEMGNVRVAWETFLATGAYDQLAESLDGLQTAYQHFGFYAEAIDLLRRAVEGQPPSLLCNRLRLAEATFLAKLGKMADAVERINEVLASDQAETRLQAQIQLGHLYEQTGRHDAAFAMLQEGLNAAPPDSDEAADIWTQLGSLHGRRREGELSITAHDKGIELSAALGDELRLAENYALKGITLRDMTRYDDALRSIDAALEIVERLNHREKIGYYTHFRASIFWQQDDLETAKQQWETALMIAESIQHKRNALLVIGALGIIASRQQRHQEALEYYERACKLAYEIGERELLAINRGNMANIYRITGQFEQAIEQYEAAAEMNRQMEAIGNLGINLANIGDALKMQGRYAEALPYFKEGIDAFRQTESRYYLCWGLVALAEALFELGRFEAAEQANREGGEVAFEIKRQTYQFLSELLATRLLAQRGEDEKAVHLLEEMRGRYDGADEQIDIAFTLWQITQSGEHREAALAGYTERYAETQSHVDYERIQTLTIAP